MNKPAELISLALFLGLPLLICGQAWAGAPQRITYQGTLRKAGAIYTGTVPMEFKITNADGSVTWWTSGSTGVYVSGGLFRYPLGTPNEAQFAVIPWGTVSPYVRVIVDGAALPADPLQSAPYAMHAGTAEGSAGSFNLADGDIRISTTSGNRGVIFQDGSAQYTAAASGLWTASGIDIYNSNAGGVGIGTASPSQKLEVAGTAKATAFQGDGSAVTNITASNIAGGSFADSAYTFPNNVTISGSLGADLNAGNFTITNLADPSSPQDGATKNYVDSLVGAGAVISATQTFTGQNSFTNQVAVSSNLFVTGGRIGVGTSSPGQELDVVGTAKATAFQGDGAAVTNITASNIAGGSFADSAYTFPNNVTISGSLGAALNAGGFKITNLADPSGAQDVATKNYVDGLAGGAAVLSATQTFTGTNGFSNQVTISSNLFVTNGSVGIGTADPGGLLDAAGTSRFIVQLAGQAAAVASLFPVGQDSSYFQVYGTNDTTLTNYERTTLFHDAAGGVGGIYTDAGGTGTARSVVLKPGGTEVMRLTTSGNVGIGTTDPKHKLDSRGNLFIGSQLAGVVFPTVADTIYLGHPRKFISNTLGVAVDGSTDWINLLAHPGSKGIILGTSGSADATPHDVVNARVVIQSGGNVGIGTTTPDPSAKLHVMGTTNAGGTNVGTDAERPTIQVEGMYPNVIIKSQGNANHSSTLGFWAFDGANTRQWNMGVGQNGILSLGYCTDNTNPHCGLYNYGPTALTILTDGNVGIGTTSPASKLDVAGTISQNGVPIKAPATVCASVPATGGTVSCPAGKVILFAMAGRPWGTSRTCPTTIADPNWGMGVTNEVAMSDDAAASCEDYGPTFLGSCVGQGSCTVDGNTTSCNAPNNVWLVCM